MGYTKHQCFLRRWESRDDKQCTIRRWSPRGHNMKSLALASEVKSLALASKPEALENWPVLGSRTALFLELLKVCGALKVFFVENSFY